MATISFTTAFNLAVSPKQFNFEDTADYAGQGILLADVNGNFKITAPSGSIIYNNTDYSNANCDIRNGVARTNQTVIQLPLGLDGLPEQGNYTIEYTVYDTNTLEYYTATNTYSYAYVRPVVCITQTVDCVSPLFVSTDSTEYDVNGVAPTSLVRSHVLTFPVGSGLVPISSAGATITEGALQFANGTQTTQITTGLTYLFADGLTVIDSITGVQEVLVDCSLVCSLLCGLRSIETQMNNARLAGATSEYNRLVTLFSLLMALVTFADKLVSCGSPDEVNGVLTLIKTLGNFNDDCCSDCSDPTLVQGLGGLLTNVEVTTCGYPLTVTPVVAGNTTTYEVCFNEALLATILSLYNTAVSGGYGVSVSSITAGILTTYTAAVSLVVTSNESVAVFAVPVANNTAVTGCSVTAPTTGNYLVFFEADFKAAGVDADITYRLMKNASALTTDRRAVVAAACEGKLVSPMKSFALTAGDIISPEVDSLVGGTIEGRSITITRIA